MATGQSSHVEADRPMDMDYVPSDAEKNSPSSNLNQKSSITVFVLPTTGGEIKMQVSPHSKVSSLKTVISNKIKLSRDKIVLLQKNRQLTEGTLEDNMVGDGARLILVPCVEAGLLTLRPEHSVLKALNTLTDAQVDNVLMGRVPLNLSMRLGGHMMFIQLQLTTSQTNGALNQELPTSTKKSFSSSSSSSITTKHPHKLNIQMPSFMPTPPHTPTTPNKSASFTLPNYPTSSIQGTLPTPPSSPETAIVPPNFTPEPIHDSELQSTTKGLGRLQLQHDSQNQFTNETFSSITSGSVAMPKHNKNHIESNQQYNKLAEASRNLTQTLKQLSSVALDGTCRTPEKCEVRCCSKQKNGAVIESLYHHGKGIYSGTFVGSLSPSLQDRDGRPRQNISTIIHILNDLLGASLTSHPSCKTGCSEKVKNHNPESPNESCLNDNTDETALYNENEVIRSKIEHIQTMMEERKQRRKARRDIRGSPYVYPIKIVRDPATSVEMPLKGSCSIANGENMEV